MIKKTRWDKGNLEAGPGILLHFGGFLEKFIWGFRFFGQGDEIFS